MPAGSCVIRYDGVRGVVWKIKYLRTLPTAAR